MYDQRTLDTLIATRDYLDNVGWIRGNVGGYGAPACLVGAASTVTGDDLTTYYKTVHAIATYGTGSRPVAIWNDRAWRRKRTVLRMLDRVIKQVQAGLTGPSKTIEVVPEPSKVPDAPPERMPEQAPEAPQETPAEEPVLVP